MRSTLQDKGGDILAISTDPPVRLQEGLQEYPDLPCLLASDSPRAAIQKLRLVHEKPLKIGNSLAVPANILIDSNDIVRWAHYSTIVMDRVDPKKVLIETERVN